MPLATRRPRRLLLPGLLAFALLSAGLAVARADEEQPAFEPDAQRGYRHMLDKGFVPSTLDKEVLENLWQAWPEEERAEAEKADAKTRRKLVFARYGFTQRPDDPDGPPLQLAVTKAGGYHINCFTCHGGQVAGREQPGLPNAHIALQSLVEDVRTVRRKLGRPIRASDIAASMIPHGNTVGTTNAVVFSIVLLQFRDKDLNVVPPQRRLRLPHHDLDAPPWWHYKRRTHLYIDGFTPVGHRSLMQFILVPQNSREKVREYENDFKDIEAWIKTVEAPKYPYPIDTKLAASGEKVFRASCASCHGTYGEGGGYPNRLVPIAKLGTDRARLDAILTSDRETYSKSWFTNYDPKGVRTDPGGYVAPPLDGIWASAPYLHNGAVPTLHHLLFPDERPKVWRRSPTGYDTERVGLQVETAEKVPESKTKHERRQWFDTTGHGKSAAGHDFPAKLSKPQRRALLEYLKTL
ncbi:MAG: c-type cytochrome [Planctomycetota bacterium]|nr:c-type cytochrome [Planctomycetota bacterium]